MWRRSLRQRTGILAPRQRWLSAPARSGTATRQSRVVCTHTCTNTHLSATVTFSHSIIRVRAAPCPCVSVSLFGFTLPLRSRSQSNLRRSQHEIKSPTRTLEDGRGRPACQHGQQAKPEQMAVHPLHARSSPRCPHAPDSVSIHTSGCVCVCVCVCACLYACLRVCVSACMHVCTRVCMRVRSCL